MRLQRKGCCSLQQIYGSWSSLQFSVALKDVLLLLEQPSLISLSAKNIGTASSIELKDVYYKYNENDKAILSSINLTIEKGQRVGFVGKLVLVKVR